MIVNFLEEKKASSGLAIGAVIMGMIASVIWVAGVSMSAFEMTGEDVLGFITLGGIASLISGILQLIVMRQWATALEMNKDNTKIVLDYLGVKSQDVEEKFDISVIRNRIESIDIKTWAFWMYVIFYILNSFAPLLGFLGIMALLALIFYAIYLQSIFTASNQLQDVKTSMYNVLSKGDMLVNLKIIKPRNIFLVVLLSIVTLGIYAFYLLVVLTKEINTFIDQDKELRDRLILQAVKD